MTDIREILLSACGEHHSGNQAEGKKIVDQQLADLAEAGFVIVDHSTTQKTMRWLNLLSCDRVRVMGYTHDGNHMGVEFWKKHSEQHPSEDYPQERCRELFERFASSRKQESTDG